MTIGAAGLYFCLFIALYFEVFMLLSFFERRPSKATSTLPKRYPTVSMIVPCWNEEKTVAKTLDSLLALDYPKDKLEIIVVDDGSTDQTLTIAQAYTKYPQVKVFHKENGGKYTANNFGIEHSSGELVGCLDADSFVAPNGLIEMVKAFEEHPEVSALAPVMKVQQPRSLLELMQAVEYTFGVFYKKMFDNLSAISVLPGPFSLYRRTVFDKVGPFRHAHNTEDMEIAFRMHQHGLILGNAHTAFVYTTVPKTVRALVKQRTRWSQGFLENSRDYKHMYFNPRFGNFGMLILPFGLLAFAAGLYTAGYALFRITTSASSKLYDFFVTGIPLHLPASFHFSWFYLDTGVFTMLVIVVLTLTMTAIVIGSRISDTRLSGWSYLSYFMLYGFVVPLWLARAAWNSMRSRPSAWR